MIPTLLSEIVALPGWNTPMLLLLAKATLILIAALGITLAMQRASAARATSSGSSRSARCSFVPALTAWAPLRLVRFFRPRTTEVDARAPDARSATSPSLASRQRRRSTSTPQRPIAARNARCSVARQRSPRDRELDSA